MSKYDPESELSKTEFEWMLVDPEKYRPAFLARHAAGNLKTPTGKFVFVTKEHSQDFFENVVQRVHPGDTIVLLDPGAYHDPDQRPFILPYPAEGDDTPAIYATGKSRLDMYGCMVSYPAEWNRYVVIAEGGITFLARHSGLACVRLGGQGTNGHLQDCFTTSLKVSQGAKVVSKEGHFCGINKSKDLYDLRVEGGSIVIETMRAANNERIAAGIEDGVLAIAQWEIPAETKLQFYRMSPLAIIEVPQHPNSSILDY
ncbi:hypothetical protein BSR28_06825 [Boudabousia liubingyangii]|uniref:hypothetical protein n=1 Tax=Boudabousia liubingyangii TaxID=1921764 RepID=UPI00093D2108|nr:hypothetical protein [Boudabousia liubingyangii]OKL47111.1 hypothetical protein BSR28_06825 [Boudabousia liubingyangii]